MDSRRAGWVMLWQVEMVMVALSLKLVQVMNCLLMLNIIFHISEQSNHRVTKWSSGNTTAGVLVIDTFLACNLLVFCLLRLFRLLVEMELEITDKIVSYHGESMLIILAEFILSIEEIIVFNIGHMV